MKENLLLTPGPTKVLPEAAEAMAQPIIHHRTPQFQTYLKEAHEGLQYVFQTKNPVYFLASSGSGGLEAAVANLLSPGDEALCVEAGKFGERWTELCKAYDAKPTVLSVEWGHAVKAADIQSALQKNPKIKAVFVTLCETSTAVTPDIEAIGKVVSQTDAVFVVDAVSGLGVTDCQTDNWNIDIVVSASHKGFMLPPGLAFVSVSPKAEALINSSKNRRYYFDLRKSQKAWGACDTPFTPAITLVIGLVTVLRWFKEKGIENLFAKYAKMAVATREGAKALGLTIYPREDALSNVLTAINVPDGIDGGKLVKTLRDTHGVTMAGGQAELKGKIVRIAHMGCLEEADIVTGLSYLERVLKEMGYQCPAGAGESAAQKVFSQ